MKKILFLSAICAFFVLKSNTATAQVTANSNIAVKINAITELVADNTALVPFDFTTTSELENGITQTSAVNLAYKSNKITKISIHASTANFSGTSGTPMPSTVIQFRKTGGIFAALTGTTPIDFSTSQPRGTGNFNLDYKVVPGLTYDPAIDYAITVVYTLSVQ
ncbi:MAG: hypothetical protein H7Y13_13630 [Sphingobacteriaceae bacterium]|nr:hypothetical protein [Sphingobacteriaceae bacterium]